IAQQEPDDVIEFLPAGFIQVRMRLDKGCHLIGGFAWFFAFVKAVDEGIKLALLNGSIYRRMGYVLHIKSSLLLFNIANPLFEFVAEHNCDLVPGAVDAELLGSVFAMLLLDKESVLI